MKTKEEILDDEIGDVIEYPHYDMDDYQRMAAIRAMNTYAREYAKQQAIAFDDWTAYNHVKYKKGGTWVCAGKVYEQPPTTEQIYEQFIEHQSQNK